MKRFLVSLTLILFGLNSNLYAQQRNPTILKVSYVSTSLTPSMMSILKNKLPSQEQYAAMVDRISKYKFYYSLYIQTKTGESLFILDSLTKQEGVSIAGNVEYLYADTTGRFYGSEIFMNEKVDYNGEIEEVKWVLTNETKFVQGKTCQKATLNKYPYVTAWYTMDIPLSKGPGAFLGLPGLVLSASDFFNTFEVWETTTDITIAQFNKLVDAYQDRDIKKSQTYSKLLKSKDNVIHMMQK